MMQLMQDSMTTDFLALVFPEQANPTVAEDFALKPNTKKLAY